MSERSDPVLDLRGVHAGYGPFRALFGVDLRVDRGRSVALVGANGAGKTTVARVATGLLRPTAGTVHVGGADLTRARTHRFARAGVFHAPEGRSVFASLTVEENLALARRARPRAAREEAYARFPQLAARRGQRAGTLSGGEQRMLALATALIEDPVLLVADELSLGLAPMVTGEVYRQLAEIRSRGTALLIVEQQVSHALELCDDVVLLRRGAVAWSGPSQDASTVVSDILGVAGPAESGPGCSSR